MRKWDEQLMAAEKIPVFYKRFIDDGFGVWTGSVEDLQSFARHANSIHPNIKVDLRYNAHSIEFLDTMVKLENGHVYTDLYVKPTDKQLYLRKNSCHPPNTKKSLAYGLGLRIRRICEKEEDYQKHRADLKSQLRKRGYSGAFIENQLQKVDRLDRSELLTQSRDRKRRADDRVPLVVTYSNLLPNVHDIVFKHMHVLHQSERMERVFSNPPLVAYRRDNNLSDTLVHGKTNRLMNRHSDTCEDGCLYCGILLRTDIQDTPGQATYQTEVKVNCRLQNVVYAIRCSRCEIAVYVGETERRIQDRMKEHLRDVRLQKEKPIMCHFRDTHRAEDLRFSVLAKLYSGNHTERVLRETVWIKRLKTQRPHGCNVKDVNLPLPLRR